MPAKARKRVKRTGTRSGGARWSKDVTERSNALDLEPRVFQRSPREIARSLKRSAERSTRRKASPFRSAMSMLTFYENRAGRNLGAPGKRALREAKDELRKLYGRQPKRPRRRRRSEAAVH